MNRKNLFKGCNTIAIPILILETLEKATRKLLTKNKIHHPKLALKWSTLRRHEGSHGLVDISRLCQKQTKGLAKYFSRQNTDLNQAVKKSDNRYISSLYLL